jgi:hypothetical protein
MRLRVFAGIGAIVVLLWSVPFAQNARVDAMGGCTVIDDIARVVVNPADVARYPDNIQGTATGAAIGTVIATKSVGDALVFGVLANRGNMLAGDFYTNARSELNTLSAQPSLAGTMARIPHVLFGADFGGGQLGLDLFFEIDRAKAVTTMDPGGAKVTQTKAIYHPGALFSLNLGDGPRVTPMVGGGAPRVKGMVETDPGGGGSIVRDELVSKKYYYIRGGLETAFPGSVLDFTLGLNYALEWYQFARDAGGTETKGPEYPTSLGWGYVGLVGYLPAEILLALQYDVRIMYVREEWKTGTAPNVTTYQYNTISQAHTVRLGLERPIKDFWFFESLVPRAGLVWSAGDLRTHDVVDESWPGGTTIETIDDDPVTFGTLIPLLGLGITKGVFAFDVRVNFGSFNGVIAGPEVVEGTVTIDFRKTPSSQEVQSAPPPPPAPVREVPPARELPPPRREGAAEPSF